MKKPLHLMGLMAGLSMMAGCTSMTPSECKHTNWEAKGESDGAYGVLPHHLTKHAQACASAGITPNRELWEHGRQKGLKNYCTELNAYHIGRVGYRFSPVCGFVGRTELMKLEQRYEEGRRRYRFERQMDDMHRGMYDRDEPWYRPWRR